MPQQKILNLSFPAGGLDKRLAVQSQRPYTTADCDNVWPDEAILGRERGGSRPGTGKALAAQLGSGAAVRMLADLTWDNSGITTVPVASSNGNLYIQSAGNWVQVVTSLSLASDRLICAVDRLGKLYIADHGDDKASGSDGVKGTAASKFDAASVADWTTKSISTDDDVLVVTDATDDLRDGVYQITSVASGELTVSPDISVGASSGGGCTWYIARGPKVYDPTAGTLSLWLADNQNEIQSIETFGTPTGGTFTLTFNGQETGTIAYNAAASAVETALEALDNINDVTVAGGPLGTAAVTIEFGDDLRYTNVAALEVTNSLTGGTNPGVSVTVTQEAKDSIVPVGNTMIENYRDRAVLAGDPRNPTLWQMSKQADWNNWSTTETGVDRAISGSNAVAGMRGEKITALAAHGDDCLLMSGTNSLWTMRSDPAYGGELDNLSRQIGILDRKAWCRTTSGWLFFLSHDGVWAMQPGCGSPPFSVSRERLPESLLNVDPSSNTIHLAYDVRHRGIQLNITPESGDGTHFWLDVNTTRGGDNEVSAAFFPMSLPEAQQPTAVLAQRDKVSSYSVVLLGAVGDGYVRRLEHDAGQDDGTDITSYVLYGPLALGGTSYYDGMVVELVCVPAANSTDVQTELLIGETPEDALAATAVDPIVHGVAGLNVKHYPRRRGAWCYVKVSNGTTGAQEWSVEELQLLIQRDGRRRF